MISRIKFLSASEAGQLHPKASSPVQMLRLPCEVQIQDRVEDPHGRSQARLPTSWQEDVGSTGVSLAELDADPCALSFRLCLFA